MRSIRSAWLVGLMAMLANVGGCSSDDDGPNRPGSGGHTAGHSGDGSFEETGGSGNTDGGHPGDGGASTAGTNGGRAGGDNTGGASTAGTNGGGAGGDNTGGANEGGVSAGGIAGAGGVSADGGDAGVIDAGGDGSGGIARGGAGSNLILNGDFADDDEYWNYEWISGYYVNEFVANGQYCVSNDDFYYFYPASFNLSFPVSPNDGFGIEADVEYSFSYFAEGTADIVARIVSARDPADEIAVFNDSVDDSSQTFTHSVVVTEAASPVGVVLSVVDLPAPEAVCFDDVSFSQM